jgi:hypothetical protein
MLSSGTIEAPKFPAFVNDQLAKGL